MVSVDAFIGEFVAKLRLKSADLRAYGASDSSQTCEQVATDLQADFRAWWLAELTVTAAAEESGYTEEHLRSLVRDHKLPATKGKGAKGHLRIARCDLPYRPKAPEAPVSDIGTRLLQKREKNHLRPAS